MRFGVHLPSNFGWERAADLLALAQTVEELRFDSAWVSEHVFHVGYLADRLGGRPYYSPLPVLSAVAALTSRIRLGTSVLVLPYHQPALLAKNLATLDVLSDGRLTVGVGAGVLREEFEALGADYTARGAVTDEAIAILVELWTNPEPAFSGRFHHLSGLRLSPRPVQRPHPPIWVGGSSRAAIRRAALLGNGWHLFRQPAGGHAAAIRTLRETATAVGRDADAIMVSVRCDLNILDHADGTSAGTAVDYNRELGERYRLHGTREQIATTIGHWRETGVGHLVLAVNSTDPQSTTETLHVFAADIAPMFA